MSLFAGLPWSTNPLPPLVNLTVQVALPKLGTGATPNPLLIILISVAMLVVKSFLAAVLGLAVPLPIPIPITLLGSVNPVRSVFCVYKV